MLSDRAYSQVMYLKFRRCAKPYNELDSLAKKLSRKELLLSVKPL